MIESKTMLLILSVFSLLLLFGCKKTANNETNYNVTLDVTATAYNSVESQTKKGNIGLAAWGDTLVPGEKAIAVSRDLIKMGLSHKDSVKIEGLEGNYVVKDKMNKRWEKKIDVYMGLDEEAAKEWGKRSVTIQYYEDDTTKVNQLSK